MRRCFSRVHPTLPLNAERIVANYMQQCVILKLEADQLSKLNRTGLLLILLLSLAFFLSPSPNSVRVYFKRQPLLSATTTATMHQFNYTLVPERHLDIPVHRKGWRPPVKPRPRPYPKPAASVGVAAAIAARRRSREDARSLVPAPGFQNVVVFQDNYVGRPIDTPVHRKGCRPVKPRPRPYPKPAASIGVAAVLAARRRSREDARSLVPAPAIQDAVAFQDNYVGVPPVVAGYVPEYGDDMEVDATGPFFTPVVSNATDGNSNPLPHGAATTPGNGIFNGAPGIQIMVGYVPEFSEAMEVDWEGPSIPSGNPVGMTKVPCHPILNGPPYAGPPVMAENVFAVHLGSAGNPYNPGVYGPHRDQVPQNAFPLNAGLVDPPYDPREPLFPTRPPVPHLNAEDNIPTGRNVNVLAPSYPVHPPALEALNAPAIVIAEEHPGDRGELFNELFGDDGEEDEEEDEVEIII